MEENQRQIAMERTFTKKIGLLYIIHREIYNMFLLEKYIIRHKTKLQFQNIADFEGIKKGKSCSGRIECLISIWNISFVRKF